MTYKCPKCGSVFEGQLSFCPSCGSKLIWKDKNQDQSNQETKEFVMQRTNKMPRDILSFIVGVSIFGPLSIAFGLYCLFTHFLGSWFFLLPLILGVLLVFALVFNIGNIVSNKNNKNPLITYNGEKDRLLIYPVKGAEVEINKAQFVALKGTVRSIFQLYVVYYDNNNKKQTVLLGNVSEEESLKGCKLLSQITQKDVRVSKFKW